MAEILVKAQDATHPDPVKDQRGSYKRGMPVVVMPDGHEWGAAEGLPKFFVVRLPGIAVAQVKGYCEPEWDPVPVLTNPEPIRRRQWRVRFEAFSPEAQALIMSKGVVTVSPIGDFTWDRMKAFLWSYKLGFNERRSTPRA